MSEENKGTEKTGEQAEQQKPVETAKESLLEKTEVPEKPKESPKQEEAPDQQEAPKTEEHVDQQEALKAEEPSKPKEPSKQQAPEEIKTPKHEEGVRKNKKINIMTSKEIDAKLKIVKEKMGSLKSRYAKQLLKQKDILEESSKRQNL
jgi:hypothetical protein